MATIALELPDPILEQVRAWVRARTSTGAGGDEQALLAELLVEAVRVRASKELYDKLEASSRSGRVRMSEADWVAMRDRVLARAGHRSDDIQAE